jgi:carbon monoxide dehydrogenase subunit G
MQNGAQNQEGRLLGFVRVQVGGRVFQLPVQAVSFEKDGAGKAGGFFDHEGQLGILVEETGEESQVQAQIEAATAGAVRHISRKVLN